MYRRMKMLLGGLILSTGLLVATPVSYAAETNDDFDSVEDILRRITAHFKKGYIISREMSKTH